MTNHKEILRLHSLGISNKDISVACKCSRNTVTRVLQRAAQQKLRWEQTESLSGKEVTKILFPDLSSVSPYRMPDYEHVHREMQKSGVTLAGQIRNNIDYRVCGRADNVLSQIILDNTSAADAIDKDAQGRFINAEGTVFQGYFFDEGTVFGTDAPPEQRRQNER